MITIIVFALLLLQISKAQDSPQQPEGLATENSKKNYHHMIVLVHGYIGTYREQEYLREALIKKSSSHSSCSRHLFSVFNSKANTKDSTDGIIQGGERLATEISSWIMQQRQKRPIKSEEESGEETFTMTLSIVGNSLGGLYSRYALSKLDWVFKGSENNQNNNNHYEAKIIPLIFCTTASPHLGISQDTFLKFPRWMEESYVPFLLGQQPTMNDLFRVKNSTIVMEMCHNHYDYLHPLGKFHKRIAVANAYQTDFLVSVSSAAMLSSKSDSMHYHQNNEDNANLNSGMIELSASMTRLMKNSTGHVALQVATTSVAAKTTAPAGKEIYDTKHGTSRSEGEDGAIKSCVDNLDRLGWLKIFLDTRNMFSNFLNLPTTHQLEKKQAIYASRELREQFHRYGTLFPVAHPLNMANSKTSWYRALTKRGQPIMDDLAELLVLDMIEFSEVSESSAQSS